MEWRDLNVEANGLGYLHSVECWTRDCASARQLMRTVRIDLSKR